MKKKLSILFLTLIAFAAFSACTNSKPNTPATPTPTEIVFATATPSPVPTATNTPTPTFTPSPTPTPTEIPVIVTDETENTTVFLGEYKGLVLNPVTDAEVDENITAVLYDYATDEEVDRESKLGDIVYIYFVGKIDGVEFEGGSYTEGAGYELTLGSGTFIDGFEDQLVGKKKDDTCVVTITFPADYAATDLAGKTAEFDVTINHVCELIVPTLTDEFVKENLGFETAEEYKANVKANLSASAYENQILEYLSETRIENLPASEITAYSDQMYSFYYRNALIYSAYLNLDINTTLNYYYGVESPEVLREVTDFIAPTQVKYNHIYKAIAINEGISISDDDMNTWVDNHMSEFGYSDRDGFISAYGKEYAKSLYINETVYNMILENAVIKAN